LTVALAFHSINRHEDIKKLQLPSTPDRAGREVDVRGFEVRAVSCQILDNPNPGVLVVFRCGSDDSSCCIFPRTQHRHQQQPSTVPQKSRNKVNEVI
jgi:hypothetical protein